MSSSMWAWRVVVPALALSVCLVILWQSTRGETPRAPNQGVALPDGPRTRLIAEGRVTARPGSLVTLGTEAGGTVARLIAREKAKVKVGDVLVELRSEILQADLAEAEARLVEADAELGYARREFEKRSKSATDASKFQTDLESNRRDFEVALARRKVTMAVVERCRLMLGRSKVASPIDGVVIACFVQGGETVASGSPLVTVCDLSRLRIEAEVDAFDVPEVAVGDDVLIKAEGYGKILWNGKVEEIPDQVADRSVAQKDPGRPTDTRVFRVKIAPTESLSLRLGQPVELEIRPRPR